ncbi:hypothetical protein HDV05_003468 [Chytridiales sp. JEL 0842]|nr:hypothetical protein HDV05_003468 [Chytridiales sp. JEL 0842]
MSVGIEGLGKFASLLEEEEEEEVKVEVLAGGGGGGGDGGGAVEGAGVESEKSAGEERQNEKSVGEGRQSGLSHYLRTHLNDDCGGGGSLRRGMVEKEHVEHETVEAKKRGGCGNGGSDGGDEVVAYCDNDVDIHE